MISHRKLGMKKAEGILDTPKKIKELRKELEDSTATDFSLFQIAKIKAWNSSYFIVLD